MSLGSYKGECYTVDKITISGPGIDMGVAQVFNYRYEFKLSTLYGLNTLSTYVIFTRPNGVALAAHAITGGSAAAGKPTKYSLCSKGNLVVTGIGSGASFSCSDAILARVEGKVTVENFIFFDSISWIFFNYT